MTRRASDFSTSIDRADRSSSGSTMRCKASPSRSAKAKNGATSESGPGPRGSSMSSANELRMAAHGEMLDGRGHELRLRREVVELRAARDTRSSGDVRGGGAGVADVEETVDRRIEKARGGGRGPFRLRPPSLRSGTLRQAGRGHTGLLPR